VAAACRGVPIRQTRATVPGEDLLVRSVTAVADAQADIATEMNVITIVAIVGVVLHAPEKAGSTSRR
jgi:hypothetical protein